MRGHVKTFVILFMNVDVQKHKGMTEKKVNFKNLWEYSLRLDFIDVTFKEKIFGKV